MIIVPERGVNKWLIIQKDCVIFTLWNVESLIHVLLHSSMGNRWQECQQHKLTREEGTHK